MGKNIPEFENGHVCHDRKIKGKDFRIVKGRLVVALVSKSSLSRLKSIVTLGDLTETSIAGDT